MPATYVSLTQTLVMLQSVVCLRGGERGTCLGPFRHDSRVNSSFFGGRRITLSYNILRSRSKVSSPPCFQRPPNNNSV